MGGGYTAILSNVREWSLTSISGVHELSKTSVWKFRELLFVREENTRLVRFICSYRLPLPLHIFCTIWNYLVICT